MSQFIIEPYNNAASSSQQSSMCFSLKGNQSFSEKLLQLLKQYEGKDIENEIEIIFINPNEAKLIVGEAEFELKHSNVNTTVSYYDF